VKVGKNMKRTLMCLVSIIGTITVSSCGGSRTQSPAVNANQNVSNTAGRSSTVGTGSPGGTTSSGPTTTNTGESAGSGPQNQGIGGGSSANGNR
jgi:hypothetical protein